MLLVTNSVQSMIPHPHRSSAWYGNCFLTHLTLELMIARSTVDDSVWTLDVHTGVSVLIH